MKRNKKTLNGRAYDPNTAELVFTFDDGLGNAESHKEMELYRKRNGEYFLWTYGFIQESEHSHSATRKEVITPMTITEAQAFAAPRMTAKEYEAVFNAAQEEKVMIGMWVPVSVKAAADNLRASHGYQLSDIFIAGINAVINAGNKT